MQRLVRYVWGLRERVRFEWMLGALALASVAGLTLFISSVIARAATQTALATGASEARSSLNSLILHGLSMYRIEARHLDEPLQGEQLKKFDTYVRRSILSERVAHVVIWSNAGSIVYSDEQANAAAADGGDQPREQAGAGRTSADVTSDGHVAGPRAPEEHSGLLEVYTPLYLPGIETPVGVLEFYQPRDLILSPLARVRYTAIVGVGGGLMLSFVALIAVTRNRTRIIATQRDALGMRAAALESSSRALSHSEARFRALVARSCDATLTTDPDGRISYASPPAIALWGWSEADLLGKTLAELVRPEQRAMLRTALLAAIDAPASGSVVEFTVDRPDGSSCEMEARVTNLLGEPAVEALVLNCRDVSEHKRQQDELSYLAFHDPLTGLGNRALLAGSFASVAICAARSGRDIAMLAVDLDRLKLINDGLGHPIGDGVLVETARRLRAAAPEGWTVARFGGDEFAILAEAASREQVFAVARRVIDSLHDPITVEGHSVTVSGSLGVAFARAGECDLREMMRRADTAMYRAKGSGRGRWVMYDEALDASPPERLALEADLRRAVVAGELVLCYQPQFKVGSEALWGFEALVRWAHPTRGLLLPHEFIPVAEDTGDIVPIGRWVLREALRVAKLWEGRSGGRHIGIAVNVSVRELELPDFVPYVLALLRELELPAAALKLELTETVMMEIDGEAAQRLRTLREAGVGIALDDFGTGYSSLSYLQRLPLDTLKIDRSFVADCERDEGARSIMQGIVSLAKALDMQVIAEGVEDAGQLLAVGELGVDAVQGFYYSPAVRASEAESFFDLVPRDEAAA